MTQNALSPLARFGMGPDPYEWRSNMDAPRPNALSMDQLRQGPMPSGYDRVRDTIYNWLGGQPTNAWAANKLATAFDVGTMGLATGAYDGGQELAKGNGPGYLAAAIMPGMRPVGAAVKAAAPVAREAAQGIRAYHGSPHDFDRFDLSKIGTGEGAQAYGHGLYFAENEGVAKSYRKTLSRADGGIDQIAQTLVDQAGGDWKKALQKFEREALDRVGKLRASGLNYELPPHDVATLQALRRGEPGRMYEVNIKASPNDFLDWDKPLSQQSDSAQSKFDAWSNSELDRLRKEGGAKARRRIEEIEDIRRIKDMPLGNLAKQLNMFTPERAQSMGQSGIPGVRYLDHGSRAGGEGSRNLVVFDESLIEILRKYGLLPPAALGAAAATQDPAQASP